jgi:RNA polymerase sigma factor (sigma-70 family)
MHYSDEEILTAFNNEATKEKALCMLMNTYQEKLYSQIWRMTQNHSHTDDILQNTFVKVWKGIHTFKSEAKLYTWLYRIARNETLNFLQKENRHTTVVFEDFKQENNFKTQNEVLTPEDIQQQLDKALLQLPDKQRDVFCMRYYDELTYEEMSKVTGTTVGALKASYHHAAKKIESFLTGN